jgi:hypothetical protein
MPAVSEGRKRTGVNGEEGSKDDGGAAVGGESGSQEEGTDEDGSDEEGGGEEEEEEGVGEVDDDEEDEDEEDGSDDDPDDGDGTGGIDEEARIAAFTIAPTLADLLSAGKVNEHGQLVNDAFMDDTTLIKVVLPDGVTSIEDGAWDDYEDGICYGAFYGCSSLQEVVLPRTCTAIGDYAQYSSFWGQKRVLEGADTFKSPVCRLQV